MAFDVRKPQPIFLNLSADEIERDLSNHVLRFHTRKTLNYNAGTWEVEFVPQPDPHGGADSRVSRQDWESFIYKSIRPMDGVIIGMYGTHPTTGQFQAQHLMFGFVDRIYKSKTTIGQRVERSIRVMGRDATKLFVVDNIALAPELATDPDVRKFFKANESVLNFMNFIRGLDPKTKQNIFVNSYLPEAIYWILANAPFMRVTLDAFEGGMKKPFEIFRTFLQARAEDKVFDYALNMYAGSVMNYMVQIIDPAFYELWVDTLPYNSPLNDTGQTRPCLILRPKPYDFLFDRESDGKPIDHSYVRIGADGGIERDGTPFTWETAVNPIFGESTVEIPEEDVLMKGLGVSDEEVYTMYKCFGSKDVLSSSAIGRFGFYFPLIDANMLRLFGMRELQGQSKLLPQISDDIVDRYTAQDTDLEQRQQQAKDWGVRKPEPASSVENVDREEVHKIIEINDQARLTKRPVVRLLTKEKRDRLWRWNRYNHILESGNITIKGRVLQVGCKVFLPEEETRGNVVESGGRFRLRYQRGMEYYVVAVDHSYAFGQHWTTTAALTRGHNHQQLKDYHDLRKFEVPAGPANSIFTRNREGDF